MDPLLIRAFLIRAIEAQGVEKNEILEFERLVKKALERGGYSIDWFAYKSQYPLYTTRAIEGAVSSIRKTNA